MSTTGPIAKSCTCSLGKRRAKRQARLAREAPAGSSQLDTRSAGLFSRGTRPPALSLARARDWNWERVSGGNRICPSPRFHPSLLGPPSWTARGHFSAHWPRAGRGEPALAALPNVISYFQSLFQARSRARAVISNCFAIFNGARRIRQPLLPREHCSLEGAVWLYTCGFFAECALSCWLEWFFGRWGGKRIHGGRQWRLTVPRCLLWLVGGLGWASCALRARKYSILDDRVDWSLLVVGTASRIIQMNEILKVKLKKNQLEKSTRLDKIYFSNKSINHCDKLILLYIGRIREHRDQ